MTDIVSVGFVGKAADATRVAILMAFEHQLKAEPAATEADLLGLLAREPGRSREGERQAGGNSGTVLKEEAVKLSERKTRLIRFQAPGCGEVMDPLSPMGLFLLGGGCGYVVGAQAVAEKVRPGIDRMADRIAELEGELLDAKKDKGVKPIYRTAIEQAFSGARRRCTARGAREAGAGDQANRNSGALVRGDRCGRDTARDHPESPQS